MTLTFGDTIIAANVVAKVKDTAMKYFAEAVIEEKHSMKED